MPNEPYGARPRPLLLSPEAWEVAETLANATGVTPVAVIEILLRDAHGELELEPEPEPRGNVIPISRGRRRRRR